MVRNKKKVQSIEEQMAEFEARLRRQLLRGTLEQGRMVQDSFDTGSTPQIHVSIGALTASKPAPRHERVLGDWGAAPVRRSYTGQKSGKSRSIHPMSTKSWYAAVAGALALTGFVACLVRAWRAMRADPIVALRRPYERNQGFNEGFLVQ
jgi:predicted exporter